MSKLATLYNQVKISKLAVESMFLFLINPFLSFPALIISIYNKHKSGVFLFIVLIGLISFLYIPHVANDKAKYFYNSILFSRDYFGLKEFFQFIVASNRPDFFLLLIIWFFAKLGMSYSAVSFFITIFSLIGFVIPFWTIIKNSEISKKNFLLLFFLLIFNISLPSLFSGTRFYFAFSFVVLGLYYGLTFKKHFIALILLTLAFLTHFSMVIFIPLYIIFANFWKANTFITIFFFFSFLFVFIPKEMLYTILSAIGLPSSYQTKADVYFASEEFLNGNQNLSTIAIVSNFIKSTWIYLVLILSIIFFKTKSQLKSILFILMSISNLVYSVPLVYGRLVLMPKLILVLWIAQLYSQSKIKPVWVNILFSIFLFGFIADIAILRNNLVESLFRDIQFQ